MEKQLLDRIKKLEQNVVNLYQIQGTGGNTSALNLATTLEGTIYSINPTTSVPGETQYNSIFLGFETGQGATNAHSSNFFGPYAGKDAVNANNSNFFGFQAGTSATNASDSNFFGSSAGLYATGSNNSNFFGDRAGRTANNARESNFFGVRAGDEAVNAHTCNFFGTRAGANSSGNNVNAFGYSAGENNTLSNQTIFSNVSLPSFINRAAAVAAITVLNGASVGSTYLYYNATTFGIEAVRLLD